MPAHDIKRMVIKKAIKDLSEAAIEDQPTMVTGIMSVIVDLNKELDRVREIQRTR